MERTQITRQQLYSQVWATPMRKLASQYGLSDAGLAKICKKHEIPDITYLPTCEGFTYLCAIEDMYSRKIVGWATSRVIDAELVLAAFDQAAALRNPPPGLILHSDRGSQYASAAFRRRLDQRQCLQSMSRRGNCYDNAPMESFFKSYKTEALKETLCETHEQATRQVTDYIERFYNPTRLHSTLEYQSPLQFEKENQ